MYPIIHRVNRLEELTKTSSKYGVEIDVRDYGQKLVLQHDPFVGGEVLENYLQAFYHKILIVNSKSDRIEYAILELLQKHAISNYFFLDCSFPMIISLVNKGIKNIAIRYSEYESIETIENMKQMVNWVWVDCFTHLPFTPESYQRLKETGLKLCLVSPDLLNRENEISAYKNYITQHNMHFDAVCTKKHNVHQWF